MEIRIPSLDEGRFNRFELISWWEQERLKKARILVIGAGAIGNELIKNLALIGIGNVLIADLDKIELSNLTRSPLYRESDLGKYKAEAACSAARQIYADMRTHPFIGNVVHDLGLGVYFWADVILGGLDNREARVAINTAAHFAGKPWIDGAIEVLNGVARVFTPGDGPCYECTMNATDWKMLEMRRSCALLTRQQMQEGKVPTTPTTSSIVAGVQVQEALKLLHGMESIAGKGFVYNGLAGDAYTVSYTRKPDCFAHDRYEKLELLGTSVEKMTLGELKQRAKKDLGDEAGLHLHRDLITGLTCAACGTTDRIFASLGRITEKDGVCPRCKEMRAPEITSQLELLEDADNKTFAELSVPPFDVITARNGEASVSYLFDGDAPKILGDLER